MTDLKFPDKPIFPSNRKCDIWGITDNEENNALRAKLKRQERVIFALIGLVSLISLGAVFICL